MKDDPEFQMMYSYFSEAAQREWILAHRGQIIARAMAQLIEDMVDLYLAQKTCQ